MIELLFPPPVAESIDRDFGEVVAKARAELSPEALDQQERAMTDWHDPGRGQRGLLPKLPVLAAAGTLDQLIPPVNASLLAGEEGWLARFPGAGHGFMAQQPGRLGGLIRSFLAR
jgi:pimeloyl-ACP methyl ester carboxylesterase